MPAMPPCGQQIGQQVGDSSTPASNMKALGSWRPRVADTPLAIKDKPKTRVNQKRAPADAATVVAAAEDEENDEGGEGGRGSRGGGP